MTDKLPAALQTADAPDVYEVGPFVTNDFVKAGFVADLSDLYTPDITKDFGAAMGFHTINGKPYGIKMINDSIGIYYRKSVLAAAGVKPPTTIDELIAAAKKLTTNKQTGLFIGNDGGKSNTLAELMLWSTGAELVDKNGQVAFDTDRVAASWAKAKELSDSGALLIGSPTDWWDPSAFTDGTVAMQLTGLWAMPGIKAAIGDDFGVVPWPAFDAKGTPTTWLGGWTEVVNPKGAHVAEAKAFAKWEWIENAKVQQDWSVGYGFHIPPRASTAATTDKLSTGQAADFVAFVGKYAKLQGSPFWTAAMDQDLTDAMSNILANSADPKAELDKATKKINAELLITMSSGPAPAATAAATATK